MKKENIRSKYVKESLDDFNNITNSLKESTADAVRDLLNEAVRETYAQILSEDEDKDEEYEVEEVEDTTSENENEDENAEDATAEDAAEDVEMPSEDETDDEPVDVTSEEGVDDEGNLTGETEVSGEDEDGGEWSDFEKYKISDGEYDFSNAEDEEIVKVYKLLKDDDQVVVKKDDGKVNIKDNETGAEYIVMLDDDDACDADDANCEDNVIEDENEFENMNESIIYEVALNEYDSNVGYTDNYQSKDVMTNPGMSEPGKGNDWDAGVPKGDEKPWSGQPDKKTYKPFDAGKGKTVEEEVEDTDAIEESIHTVTQNGPQRRSVTISQVPDTSRSSKLGRNARIAKKPGQFHGTGEAAYQGMEETNESIRRKANKIFKENKELKNALGQFKAVLKEAAVTNVNLGQIIKLISENSTTSDEKKEIIARFGKEARTVEDSKKLYESISNELKKRDKMNINEETQFTATGSQQINETQIYQSEDLLNSLDLMHRLCK